jgi:hypothetical protein
MLFVGAPFAIAILVAAVSPSPDPNAFGLPP